MGGYLNWKHGAKHAHLSTRCLAGLKFMVVLQLFYSLSVNGLSSFLFSFCKFPPQMCCYVCKALTALQHIVDWDVKTCNFFELLHFNSGLHWSFLYVDDIWSMWNTSFSQSINSSECIGLYTKLTFTSESVTKLIFQFECIFQFDKNSLNNDRLLGVK